MRKLLLAAALGTSLLTGAAIAQDRMGGGGMMQRADTNGDGSISRAEFIAQSDQRFARLDKNGDGKLTADELAGGRGMGGRGMTGADANGDGVITRAEFTAQAEDRFAKLDANHDGQISADEMTAMMGRMREGRGGPGGPGAMPPPPPPPGAAGGPMGGHRGHGGHGGMLARIDTNHDGKISRDEMRAQADEHFAKLDANHDGFIDKAEMDAAHERMRERMGKMRGHRGPGAPGVMPAPGDAPKPDTGQ